MRHNRKQVSCIVSLLVASLICISWGHVQARNEMPHDIAGTIHVTGQPLAGYEGSAGEKFSHDAPAEREV